MSVSVHAAHDYSPGPACAVTASNGYHDGSATDDGVHAALPLPPSVPIHLLSSSNVGTPMAAACHPRFGNTSFALPHALAGVGTGGSVNSSLISAGGTAVPQAGGERNLDNPPRGKESGDAFAVVSSDRVGTQAASQTPADGSSPTGEVAMREVDRMPAMIGYFGYMFGGAAINAFFGIILNEDKGFTKTTVGLLVSITPVFKIVLLPALSFVADRFDCANRMLCVCAVGSTLTVAWFALATNTAVVLVAFLLLIAFQTPMNPLLDKHTLLMFPSQGRSAAWGYVRSYGAYGWGVGNPIAGALVQWAGTWAVAALQYSIGQVALLYCMYTTKPYERIDHATSSSVRFKDVLVILVRNKRLLLFLFASCMMGMGYSFIENFLFIFLDELGGSKFLMGLTLLITVSTEIPIFQCSDRLHATLTERQMMTLAMLIWTARVLGYSILHRPWLVLFLEPLHGVTFALMWLPGVKLISEAFPPELASSATGVLFTFVSGFGAIIGNVFAGVLYDTVGARWMFRIAATAMLTAFTVYQLTDRYLERAGHLLGKPHERAAEVASTVVVEGAGDGEPEEARA